MGQQPLSPHNAVYLQVRHVIEKIRQELIGDFQVIMQTINFFVMKQASGPEKAHAYTPKQADDLFRALQEGEEFLKRDATWNGRQDPWEDFRKKAWPINQAYEEAKRSAERALQEDDAHLFDAESLLQEIYGASTATAETEKTEEQMVEEFTIGLQALIAEPELDVKEFIIQGKTLIRETIKALAQGPRYISEKRLKDAGIKTEKGPNEIKTARYNVWNYGDHGLRMCSYGGIIRGPLSAVIKTFKQEVYARKIALAAGVKETALEKIKRPSERLLKRENFRLSENERETLYAVLDQCREFFIRRYGIAAPYGRYIDTEDLTLEDFKLALAAAPKALQETAFQALLALQRGELLKVLLHPKPIVEFSPEGDQRRSCYPIIDEAVPQLLKTVGMPRTVGSSDLRSERGSGEGARKDLVLGGTSSLKEGVPRQNTLFYDTELALKGSPDKPIQKIKWVACHGSVQDATVVDSKLLGFTGNLRNCALVRTEIHNPRGRIAGSIYEDCKIDVAEGFTAKAGMMMKCKLNVGAGAKFKGLAFYATKITLPELGTMPGQVVFEECDLSTLKLSEEELVRIAEVSSRCEFNDEQMQVLAQRGLNIEARSASTRNETMERILARPDGTPFEIQDWTSLCSQGGAGTMEVDMLHPDRRSLKGVPPSPVLGNAGLSRDFDPRWLARPLGRERIGELTERVKAYTSLATFVDEHPDPRQIKVKAWLEFFKTLGTATAASCFGIPEVMLEFDASYLDALPDTNPIVIVHGQNGAPTQYVRDKASLEETGGKMRSTQDRYGNRRDHRVSRFTKHQWLKQKFLEYLANLHQFGLYLKGLTEMGYCYPELDETVPGLEFEGLVHPDVHKKLGDSVQRNDIHVLLAEEGGVMNISSAENNDGKSTLQSAIALALSQAQSGLPVPAQRARLNPRATFDAIMVMPNTRADAGQGDGVMKERIKAYADLRDRLRKQALNGNTRALVLMDEISMGATNATAAAAFDTNTVLEVVEKIPELKATVVAIVQDAEEIVPRWQAVLGQERVVLLTHSAEHAPHQFVLAQKAISSKPDTVLAEFGLEHLAVNSGWKTT